MLFLAACNEPQPRYFTEFMEDRIAREGTLARCNENREATLNDIECANARRAAGAIALQEERERRQSLEIESQAKLEALRAEIERERQRALDAQLAAEAAAKAAYDALWESKNAGSLDPAGEIDADPPELGVQTDSALTEP